jgi:hypothetical protein
MILVVAPAAGASQPIVWSKCADVPGYAKATAGDPNFDDKAVWPLSGKEKFLGEKWPAARLLVWAHPGEDGDDGGRAKHEVFKASNWIDPATGKPATKLPDTDTDILLPASKKAYTISYRKGGQEHSPFAIRHLTVEPGAHFRTSGMKVSGNVWIKRGGGLGNHGSLTFLGGRHTFCRNDNGDPSVPQRTEGSSVSQYISFNKPGASTEFFGAFSTGDEFKVYAGTFILGPDSRVQPGRNATPFVKKPATLALMDGATFGKWCNQIHFFDLHCEGTLQGGLPERPLTRDAYVGLTYQNPNGTKFYPSGIDTWPEKKKMEDRLVPLLLYAGSRIKTYSTDVKSACLVITWVGLEAKEYYTSKLLFRRMSKKGQDYLVRQLDSLPKYVMAAFAKGAEVDGVRFDRFLRDGILLEDPSVRQSWRNVFFGDDNQAPPDQLFRQAETNFSNGSYTYK